MNNIKTVHLMLATMMVVLASIAVGKADRDVGRVKMAKVKPVKTMTANGCNTCGCAQCVSLKQVWEG